MNIVDPADNLYDIYDMWHLPFWQTTAFLVVVFSFVIILIILIAWRLFVWFGKRHKFESPRDRALRELNELVIQVEPTKIQSKQFYFSLTAIIKNYLNARYLIDIDGLTDQELIPLVERGLPMELLEGLRTLFTGCILVKYADENALREKLKRDVDYALLLVKQTSKPEKNNKN